MRKLLWVVPIATILLLLTGPLARGQDEDFGPPNPQDLLSGGSTLPDTTITAPGPSSPSGTKAPPRVGPNVQVNAPQQPFPHGLLGRSETSIGATPDGQHLLVGFNDAQGFCGPPFGVACTPESPAGLSGFAFSTDAVLVGPMAERRTQCFSTMFLLAVTPGWTLAALTSRLSTTPI